MHDSDQDSGGWMPPSAPPGPDSEPPDATDAESVESTALDRELAEARAKANEYLDGWQRERAAFANYRRRTEQERAAMSQDASADVLCQLLPVLDDLGRACASAPPEVADSPWVEGVRMVLRKLEQTLERLGVEAIPAVGEQFDPGIHEALTHEVADGYREGQIVGEIARGYRMGDRVLRCSLVRVAKGSTAAED